MFLKYSKTHATLGTTGGRPRGEREARSKHGTATGNLFSSKREGERFG
jgi:hypothetical protein